MTNRIKGDSMQLYTETGTLTPRAPFDFDQALEFLGEFSPTRGEQVLAGQTLTKAVSIAGQPVVFRVTGGGTVEEPHLAYTLFAGAPLTEVNRAAALDRARFFLSLDDDLRPFYAIGCADPHMAPLIRRLYGLHQVKFLTPFENAAWAVLTQRNRIPMAQQAKRALVERYGASISVEGETYWAFPEPERLAEATVAELAALIGNEKRATYLAGIAQAFSGMDEAWMRTAPYAEVEAWLRGLKGIGPWSAAFVLIRGLGRMEQLSTGEARLGEAANRVYGRALSADKLQATAGEYGPYQGYWAYYLRSAA